MDTLKLHGQAITLVDQVEDNLLTYFRTKDLRAGNAIPNEMELAAALGVARSAPREALSRLKMVGMIETRTRRGTVPHRTFYPWRHEAGCRSSHSECSIPCLIF